MRMVLTLLCQQITGILQKLKFPQPGSEDIKELGIQGLAAQQIGSTAMKQPFQRPAKSDNEMTFDELKGEPAYLRAEHAVLKKLEEL